MILPLDLVVTSVFFRSARKPVINWVIASISRGWKSSFWLVVSNIFYFHPYLGKIPILTHIFQMGWKHQLVVHLFSAIYMGSFTPFITGSGAHRVNGNQPWQLLEKILPMKNKALLRFVERLWMRCCPLIFTKKIQKTFEHHKFEYDFDVSNAEQKNTTRQWISSCLMKFSHHGTPVILKHIHPGSQRRLNNCPLELLTINPY